MQDEDVAYLCFHHKNEDQREVGLNGCKPRKKPRVTCRHQKARQFCLQEPTETEQPNIQTSTR